MPTSVTIKPSLGVTVSSDVTLDLDPATKPFDKQSITINVGTNNAHGYSLTMNSTGTDLVNVVNSSETIATLEESTTEASFPTNKWGYRLDSGNFLPYSSGIIIGSADGITNNDTFNLTVASKVDYLKDAGSYRLDLDLVALPHVTQYYMQDFATDATLKNTVCTTEPTIIMDKRDGQAYAIAKLADGKCWMLQNLRLGADKTVASPSVTLTPEDSNVSVATTFNNKLPAPGKIPSTNYKKITDSVTGNDAWVYDGWMYYCTPTTGDTTQFVGCYYNWYTATAGTGTEASPERNNDATSSICPSGWVLPKGGASGDFQALYNQYPSAAQMLVATPASTYDNINGVNTPGFLLSGRYSSGGADYMGVYGLYWSRTAYSTGNGFNLSLNSTTVNPQGALYKYNGFSVRCLAA